MTNGGSPAQEVEKIIDVVFEMTRNWLGMIESFTKMIVMQPLGYSAAQEAASLLARSGGQHQAAE